MIGNFNDKGIFTDETLTYRTDKGITVLKGTFKRNRNTYEVINGSVKNIYTQPNDNATEVTFYSGRCYQCSQYSIGEA